MTAPALIALHHVMALLLVATLAVELTLASRDMTPRTLRLLLRVHPFHLVLFAGMIVVGLLRAELSPERLRHHLADPLFVLKIAALLLALLTNIPTSRALYRWHRLSVAMPGVLPRDWEIRNVRHWMHTGAITFVAVPMLAAFIGRTSG
jgi:uncharacterized membrane protein